MAQFFGDTKTEEERVKEMFVTPGKAVPVLSSMRILLGSPR